MTDIQAAVGLVQLGRLDEIVAPAAGARRALPRAARRTSPGWRRSRDPAYGTTQLPVVLGAARPRRSPSAATRCSRHWPTPGISARRGIMAAHLEPAYADVAARAAAGHRAAHPRLADPAAVPRADRRRPGPHRRACCRRPGQLMTATWSSSGRVDSPGRPRRRSMRDQRMRGRPGGCSASSTTTRHCTAPSGPACPSSAGSIGCTTCRTRRLVVCVGNPRNYVARQRIVHGLGLPPTGTRRSSIPAPTVGAG